MNISVEMDLGQTLVLGGGKLGKKDLWLTVTPQLVSAKRSQAAAKLRDLPPPPQKSKTAVLPSPTGPHSARSKSRRRQPAILR